MPFWHKCAIRVKYEIGQHNWFTYHLVKYQCIWYLYRYVQNSFGRGPSTNNISFDHFRVQIFYSNCFNLSKSTKLVRDQRTLIFDKNEFVQNSFGRGPSTNNISFDHFRVQIFYSNCFNLSKSTKLVRDQRTLIFDKNEFEETFKAYTNGSSKMPNNRVYLGFARQWFFDTEAHMPITAIVKSQRYQSLVDTVSLFVSTNCNYVVTHASWHC